MATYLVTGGAGFIGSNIVKTLLEKGEQVSILDNFSTGRKQNIIPFLKNKNFRLIEGDLRNSTTVIKAAVGADFILHQGALPSVPRSVADPITTNEVNVLGTLNVLEAAKMNKVKRVVYASSSSVYGNNPELPKHEGMPVQPLSPYAISKYAAERYCQVFYQLYGLETVCLRYFNVFGPNQDPTSQYSAVIPKFAAALLKNESPVIYGDGTQSRDFTFVQNNVEANLLACTAAGAAGEAINIACGERYTLNDLVSSLNNITGKNIQAVYEKDRAGDVKHSLASIDKAISILGYATLIRFEEGLKEYVKSI